MEPSQAQSGQRGGMRGIQGMLGDPTWRTEVAMPVTRREQRDRAPPVPHSPPQNGHPEAGG